MINFCVRLRKQAKQLGLLAMAWRMQKVLQLLVFNSVYQLSSYILNCMASNGQIFDTVTQLLTVQFVLML